MSGHWTGGAANRAWRRAGRDDDPGSAREDVRRILAKFRTEHGWKPGAVWDPHQGKYTEPASAELRRPE